MDAHGCRLMQMDVDGYIHIYIYTSTPLYRYTSIHRYIYVYIHLYTYTSIHVYTYTSISLHICTSIHLYMYTSTHLHISTSLPLYMYTSIHVSSRVGAPHTPAPSGSLPPVGVCGCGLTAGLPSRFLILLISATSQQVS